jgi:putative ABC transport system substrate-binding protein
LERFSGEGRRDRYAELALFVVRLKPDLIFAIGGTIAAPFKLATNTIAIVTVTADPVVVGLVTSVPHPGGNLTGVVVDPGLEAWGKRLELLEEIVPGLSKVGFLATRLN